MRKFLPTLLFATLSMPVAASQVLEQCATSRDTSVAYLRCLDSKISQLNKDRTLWGNNIIFNLEEKLKTTGRSDAIRVFKKSQKSFTLYAEHHCRWQYVLLLPDSTASATKYKECMIKTTEARVVELKSVAE